MQHFLMVCRQHFIFLRQRCLILGLMKVGDNTFPNLLALLTGLWAGERDGTGSETEEFKGNGDSDRHIDIDR